MVNGNGLLTFFSGYDRKMKGYKRGTKEKTPQSKTLELEEDGAT